MREYSFCSTVDFMTIGTDSDPKAHQKPTKETKELVESPALAALVSQM